MREHGIKTTPVFLPADGEASWSLLPSSVSLLSGGTVQPKNTYSSILKVTGLVFMSMLNINFITQLFLEILQRHCIIVILSTLGMPDQTHEK